MLAGLVVGSAGPAHAAGGHHAVDDAAIADPGTCVLDVWAARHPPGASQLLHAGPACRVGPVELALSTERQDDGLDRVQSAGVAAKWAMPLDARWSIGASVSAAWQEASPRYAGALLNLPLTWQAAEPLKLHLNIGHAFGRAADDGARTSGLAAEWTPLPAWTGVAEYFRASGQTHRSLGLRYALTRAVMLDLSQARRVDGAVPAWWTAGLRWNFGTTAFD